MRTGFRLTGATKMLSEQILTALRKNLETARGRLVGPVLCSQCFSDQGLRIASEKFGNRDRRKCPNCKSKSGLRLYQHDLEMLFVEFFWNGSFLRTDFGGAHRLASNPSQYGERDVQFPPWLKKDAYLLEDKLQTGLFHYGPPLWRVGEIEPLVDLRNPKKRGHAVKRILSAFPGRILVRGTRFYRIRKNLKQAQETDYGEYDSPPKNRNMFGRLDSKSLPVLYASEDLEICIHECRILIPDECFVATLRPTHDLQMLDLTAEPQGEESTPFESLDMAMRYLFSAEDHSYEITRAIARAARRSGFDGIYYPSYFSLLKSERIANIAIFGRPVKQKIVEIECINRAMLRSASYEIGMGPLFS